MEYILKEYWMFDFLNQLLKVFLKEPVGVPGEISVEVYGWYSRILKEISGGI